MARKQIASRSHDGIAVDDAFARELLSSASLTSILNDPNSPSGRLATLHIPDFPGYDEASVCTLALDRHLRAMRASMKSLRENRGRVKAKQKAKAALGTLTPNSPSTWLRHDLAKLKKTLPQVYFEDDFDLEQHLCNLGQKSTGMIMQEQLANVLDSVEVCLLMHIQARADAFFAALSTVHNLSEEIGHICVVIRDIRTRMRVISYRTVRPWLVVLRGLRRHQRIQSVMARLELIWNVLNSVETIKVLITTTEFSFALDLIESTRKLIEVDLAGTVCVEDVPRQLEEVRGTMRKSVVEEFVSLMLLQSESSGELAEIDAKEQLASDVHRLSRLLQSLSRIGSMEAVMEPYLKALLGKIKEQCAMHLSGLLKHAEPVTGDSVSTSETNGRRGSWTMENISHETFCIFSRQIFELLDTLLRRCEKLHSSLFGGRSAGVEQAPTDDPVLLEEQKTQKGVVSLCDTVSPDDRIRMARLMHDSLASATEEAHSRCARIIGLRNNDHANLELLQLQEILQPALMFVETSERRCNKTFYPLRGVLLSQARGFLQVHHSATMTNLKRALDTETWSQARVPRQMQRLIDRKFQPGNRHRCLTLHLFGKKSELEPEAKPEWKLSGWDDNSSSDDGAVVEEEAQALEVDSPRSRSPSSDTAKYLHANDERFCVVDAVFVLLSLVSGYINVASALPSVATEVLHRLIEAIKLWNSQSCRLILGAEALRLVAIKRITAKNLALSSQCLGLLLVQLPTIRAAMAERLPRKHHRLLENFDSVAEDLNKHRSEIFSKLVTIMSDEVSFACKTIISRDWAAAPDSKKVLTKAGSFAAALKSANASSMEVPVDPCIKDLMKQAAALHKVLSSLLTPSQRDDIFADIAKQFAVQLKATLSKLALTDVENSADARAHASANVSYVLQKLSALHLKSMVVRDALEPFQFAD